MSTHRSGDGVEELVRTLVGRAEVLTLDEEAEVRGLVESSSRTATPTVP